MASAQTSINTTTKQTAYNDNSKVKDVRGNNILAAKLILDIIRTSLGPKGQDKMIKTKDNLIIISNDGATIMKNIKVEHPAAKMLVQLSNSQDLVAGDGTTSVVVLAGSMLTEVEKLLTKNVHPTLIAEAFSKASILATTHLEEKMSIKVDINEIEMLTKCASTSLNSKVVSQYSNVLAPLAVEAVLQVVEKNNNKEDKVNLENIKIVKINEGTIEDTKLVNGLVLTQNIIKMASGPTRMEKAKVGLIQFQLSAPKPDMDNSIIVNDYRQMDKILKEERQYLLNICKKIKKAGCNVLLIQKSILRDAVNELSIHFLAKLNIMAIKDIERDEIEFISKSLGCKPIADIEAFTEDKLGYCDLVEEMGSGEVGAKKIVVFKQNNNTSQTSSLSTSSNPIKKKQVSPTVTLICKGNNSIVLDEVERSMHDALCVMKCLVTKKALICGGGAPETQLCYYFRELSKRTKGVDSLCYEAFANSFEIIPYTLAENAGLDPIKIVTQLLSNHAKNQLNYGVNVRKNKVTDMYEENVLQPLLVTSKAIELAAETVKMILKIDDVIQAR